MSITVKTSLKLVAIAGLTFSIAELRSAYGYEWTMRSIHHGLLKKPD